MAHVELGIGGRRQIERLRNARVSVVEIAARLNRHRSTIYRELARNRFTDEENPYLDGYYGSVAQTMAARRRHRRKKLVQMPLLLSSVVDRLRAGWSPEQIAGRLRRGGSGAYVCHETIYAWVYSDEGRERRLARFLPYRRKKRRVRMGRKPRRAVFPESRSIHQRPDTVARRSSR
jgi:IS30 family transposase